MAFKYQPKDPATAAFTKPQPGPIIRQPPKVTVSPPATPAPPKPAPPPPPAADWPTLPTKTAIKLRIDDDVIAAFRSTGPGWQTRINATLRAAVFPLR